MNYFFGRRLLKTLVIALALTWTGATVQAETFTVDPVHSTIGFRVPHMMISKVRGNFKEFTGTFDFDEKTKKLSQIKAEVQTVSLDTQNEKRDGHLRSPDFFDSQKFPMLRFESTKITQKGDRYEVTGNLTIKDVTKSVTLKGELLGVGKGFKGKTLVGFEAQGEINRKDFGMTWNRMIETGGFAVGDEVQLVIEIEASN
ncbi:MAG: YceI family protein [bacterium]|nr:YceI family protein [bacterium]